MPVQWSTIHPLGVVHWIHKRSHVLPYCCSDALSFFLNMTWMISQLIFYKYDILQHADQNGCYVNGSFKIFQGFNFFHFAAVVLEHCQNTFWPHHHRSSWKFHADLVTRGIWSLMKPKAISPLKHRNGCQFFSSSIFILTLCDPQYK